MEGHNRRIALQIQKLKETTCYASVTILSICMLLIVNVLRIRLSRVLSIIEKAWHTSCVYMIAEAMHGERWPRWLGAAPEINKKKNTMKKQLALMVAAALLTTGSAFAIQYEVVNGTDIFLSEGQSTSGTWNLTTDGFNPTLEDIMSAAVKFRFKDDQNCDGPESAAIVLGVGVTGIGTFTLNSGSGQTTTVSYSIGGGDLLNDLQDGFLSYTITAQYVDGYCDKGDFWLDYAKLTAQAEITPGLPTPTPTPDAGASLALLGMGLTGLGALKRKLS